MRRRALLAALGAASGALAGCDAPGSPSGTTPSTTPSDSTGTAIHPSPGADPPFAFRASVVRATPTADSPPLVRVWVRNRDADPHVLTVPYEAFPFATSHPEVTDHTLVLEADVPDSRDGDCWTGYPKALPRVTGRVFDPGETVTRTYAVLTHADAETCWPPGEFTFTETYYLDPVDASRTEGGAPFDWGFTVVVHDDATIGVRT